MIFNLFKSKPNLKELIPNRFVDIHSHILPGIDDGAKNIEESLKMISEMKKMGFEKIIATPHTYPGLYDNTTKSIKKSFEKLKKEITINKNISFASEYMLDPSLIQKATNKDFLCIRDNFILVEMSYLSAPRNLYDILFEIMINDYIPILAHPERYSFFHKNFNEYYKLKKVGCLFQLNLLSTTGYYGKNIKVLANKLIEKDLIDFVGSDIHSLKHIKAFERKVLIKNHKLLEKAIEKNKFFD